MIECSASIETDVRGAAASAAKNISQPAETEFLLIGLPAQLSKIHNPTLTISSNTTIQPVSSARNLGIIFDSNLPFF